MIASRGPGRLEELDSLRGVAAMAVVFYHAARYWAAPEWWRWFLASPLGILVAGTDAVLLFFVLSGFVLFLPYLSARGPARYSSYVMKRVCRIYLPYLAALALAVVADRLFYRPMGPEMQGAIPWTRPLPVDAILPHVLFLGRAPIFDFNGAFWSLVHEMRISLVFPAIALLAMRLPLAAGLLAGFAICVGGLTPLMTVQYTDWATVGYAGLFLVGATMARGLEQIKAFAVRMGPYGRGLGLVLAIGLLKLTHFLPERLKFYPLEAALHGAGAAVIVALALTTVHFKQVLHRPALRWLGRVSYSLYLVHDPVLYSMVCLFWYRTSHRSALVLGSVVLSVGVSSLFYRWIERPSMLLGRRLGGDGRRAEGSASSVAERGML